MAGRPNTYHVLFLQEAGRVELKGVFNYAAREVFVLKHGDFDAGIGQDVKKSLAIHEIVLPDHVGDRCEKIHETLEIFAYKEDSLTCVDVSNADPLIVAHVTMALQAGLEEFHRKPRPKAGPYASAMIYKIKGDKVFGHPLISTRNEVVKQVYWGLMASGDSMSKKDILKMLTDVDDGYCLDDVTDALLVVENWLHHYPGFIKTTEKRENFYQILPLENM
jgi:hypothetical protein